MSKSAARSRRGASAAPRPRPAASPPALAGRPVWQGAAALIVLALVVYAPALAAGFIWDDDDYVTRNATLRTLAGLARIWGEPGAVPQYYPLTFSSLWLDFHLWGLAPAGYHLVNVLLHGLGAALLWRVLVRLAVPGAWVAAAVFAVHPVHVESVAWVTERKNVLSGVLYLGAFLVYLDVALREARRPVPWRAWGAALALFVLAMLSKTVVCTFPAAVLLVVWWKRRRVDAREVVPLVPFFAIGIGLSLVTVWMETHHVGARGVDWHLSAVDRGLVAGRALWFYLGKLVWPLPLVFNYPRWQIDAGVWWQYAFPLAVVALVALLAARRARLGVGPLAAALFFAGTLVPALGFVDVFPMRYSFVADHFQYLASIGPIVLAVVWGAGVARRHVAEAPAAGRVAAGAVVGVLGVLAWRQTFAYRDLPTLWADTIAKNPASWMAHNNLGLLLVGEGRLDDAIAHYRAAIAVKPDDAFARNNLGYALAMQGRLDDAIVELRESVRLDPGNAEARSNLGNALMATGRADEAIAEYREALRWRPAYPDAHNNLATALAGRGAHDEALAHYREALRLDPSYADAHRNLGLLLAGDGDLAGAAAELAEAVRLSPTSARARAELGMVRARQGRVDEAIGQLEAALRLDPADADARAALEAARAQRAPGSPR